MFVCFFVCVVVFIVFIVVCVIVIVFCGLMMVVCVMYLDKYMRVSVLFGDVKDICLRLLLKCDDEELFVVLGLWREKLCVIVVMCRLG